MQNGLFLAALMGLAVLPARAVHNLTVNGQASVRVQPGDTLAFAFSLEKAGAYWSLEEWCDLDSDGVLDPGLDQPLAVRENAQYDGDFLDRDRQANGFYQERGYRGVIYPFSMLFIFTDNGISDTASVLCSVPPTGNSMAASFTAPLAHKVVWIENDSNSTLTFAGMSDAAGEFTIYIPDSLAGTPWHYRLEDDLLTFGEAGNSLVRLPDSGFIISGHVRGPDITALPASAWIQGRLRDPAGNAVTGSTVILSLAGLNPDYSSRTYILSSAGFQAGSYVLPAQPGYWMVYFMLRKPDPQYIILEKDTTIFLNLVDTLPGIDLVAYPKNSSISGIVTMAGGPVPDCKVEVVYRDTSRHTVRFNVTTDAQGRFVAPVSSDLNGRGDYSAFLEGLPESLAVEPESRTSLKAGADTVNFILYAKGDFLEGKAGLIREFALQPNEPNPFNPTTTFRYDVPHKAGIQGVKVSLKVYDIKGSLVRTLVSACRTPGGYRVGWDARNNTGQAVPSGVYLARMESGNYIKTRKMLLMK